MNPPGGRTGVGHVGLLAGDQLANIGIDASLPAARLSKTGAERAALCWPQSWSGHDKLSEIDFESLNAMQLCPGSDTLVKHCEALE